MGLFKLAVEHDELLTEQSIFGNEFFFSPGNISNDADR